MKKSNDIDILLGVIGYPIEHSLSPIIHEYWMNKNNIKGNYKAFNIKPENIKATLEGMRAFNIKGLNVTVPHKRVVIKYLDTIDKDAEELGAVNTIVNKNGILKGYNTDGVGFMYGLDKFKNWNKNDPILIIGSGGAASSVLYYLIRNDVKNIRIMNRTKAHIKKLKNLYVNIIEYNWLDPKAWKDVGLIINTTSLGMKKMNTLNIKLNNIKKNTIIYDIVYNPLQTKLIEEAIKNNLRFINGLDMLLGQARESFYKWFDIKPIITRELVVILKKRLLK